MTNVVQNCCVPLCKSIPSECWFYEFPEDEEMYELWTKQCGISYQDNVNERNNYYICSAHFDVNDFHSDGELYPDAIPSQNLPDVVEEETPIKSLPETSVTSPSHLFVSLFIDEAGKIVNFSLVEYSTVEKWQQDESFEYGVAEIFTNADKSVDNKLGLLGTFFTCSHCETTKDFGVVVMQKREVCFVPQASPTLIEDDLVEEIRDNNTESEHEVIHVSGRTPMIEEIPNEDEPEVVEYSDTSGTKRKLPPLTFEEYKQKKVQMTFVEESNNDETILGIKFYNKRSCNRCGYSPENEELLLEHVVTCRASQLEPCKNPYVSKLTGKGGQRIRNSYICSKCTLSILHRDLIAHAEFHVKFAPYACRCSKCFKTEDELRAHSRVCGQHIFTCKLCHKEFIKKRDLFKHKTDVHGLDLHGQPTK